MFGAAHPTGPTREQVETSSSEGWVEELLTDLGRLLLAAVVLCWRAPLLVTCCLLVLGAVWAAANGSLGLVLAAGGVIGLVLGAVAWWRPT